MCLQLIDEAIDEGNSDSDSEDDERPEADLELARSLLSCVASFTFIGGVAQLQQAGGILQLLKLMDHEDKTIRSYACAGMQNATSFLELLDAHQVTKDEWHELDLLTKHSNPTISGPAKTIQLNLEQVGARLWMAAVWTFTPYAIRS